MAAYANTDASVTVNSVDLSAAVRSAQINVKSSELDTSAMGDTWRTRIAGANDWSISIEWNQDFAASNVDATLWAALGTVVSVVFVPTSGAVSATNPSYTGNVLISDYSPIDGAFDETATVSTTWPGAATLTRAVA